MTDRIGVCGGCGARFKVPGSFTGTKAKCKKCGGVVEVEAAEDEKPQAVAEKKSGAPGAAASHAGHRGGRAGRPGRARARTGARRHAHAAGVEEEAEAGAGRTRHGGRGAPKKDMTNVYVGIGVGVVVVAIVLFLLLRGGGEEPVEPAPVATTDTTTEPVAEAPEPDPIAEAPVAPEPEPAPAPPPEPEPEAPLDPVLSFASFGKMPDISDEEWAQIQQAVRNAYIESVRPQVMRQAKETLAQSGEVTIPALINALNGLDLRVERSFIIAGNLVLAIQEVSAEYIKIPFRTEVQGMQENEQWNLKCVHSLLDLWKKYDGPDKTEELAKFRAKLGKRLAEKAAAPADEEEGN
ncbi:MAG: hypothetical protein HY812_20005 [Planctomycetes bacterium]|nr:hypothetical protein [Planctomycetota bacterium]